MSALAYEVIANLVAVVGIVAALGVVFFSAVVLGRVIEGRDKQVPR